MQAPGVQASRPQDVIDADESSCGHGFLPALASHAVTRSMARSALRNYSKED